MTDSPKDELRKQFEKNLAFHEYIEIREREAKLELLNALRITEYTDQLPGTHTQDMLKGYLTAQYQMNAKIDTLKAGIESEGK